MKEIKKEGWSKLKFFLYDISYIVEGDTTYVVMWGAKSHSNEYEKVCLRYAYEPYFFAEDKNGAKEKIERLIEIKEAENSDANQTSLTDGDQAGRAIDENKNVSGHEENRFAGAGRVVKVERIEKKLLGVERGFLKVVVNHPPAVPDISREIESGGIVCYERDIPFVHRAIRDLGIGPGDEIEAEAIVFENNTNRYEPKARTNLERKDQEKDSGREIDTKKKPVKCYLARSIKVMKGKQGTIPKSVLALDIETYAVSKEIDAAKNPILMAAVYGRKGTENEGKIFQRVITWKTSAARRDFLEVCRSEEEMLSRLAEIVSEFEPDILCGYYSDGFDLPYIQKRAEILGLQLGWGAQGSPIKVRKKAGMIREECSIRGIVHVDVCRFVQNIIGRNLKTESFSLDAVAGELLAEKKIKVSLDDLSRVWDEKKDSGRLAEFIDYNLNDAQLTYKLCKKLLPEMMELSRVVGVPLFDAVRMRFGRLVESYILRRAVEENALAPNKPRHDETEERMKESVEGAFVFEPKPGLYKEVAVFDFRSLYPSIITAHNIGPESLKCDHKGCRKKTVPGRDKLWFCQKKKAFLPRILEDIVILRSEIKAEAKRKKTDDSEKAILESRSYAFKILANSFYGYLGFYAARWYCLECSDATTAYARHYIGKTIEKARGDGFEIIYADTDSCFLCRGAKSKQEANKFMDEVNEKLPGLMELELEGYYKSAIFVPTKGSEKGNREIGAKKRYALLGEDGSLKIAGFEAVRRNSTLMARDIQEKVLGLALEDKAAEALLIVRKEAQKLKDGKMELSKLVLKTQLTRDVDKYVSIGPHVAVARRMKKKGEIVSAGMIIHYIIVKGRGLVRERAVVPDEAIARNYDEEYYLKNHLLPAVASILGIFGYSEQQILGLSVQKGLGGFF